MPMTKPELEACFSNAAASGEVGMAQVFISKRINHGKVNLTSRFMISLVLPWMKLAAKTITYVGMENAVCFPSIRKLFAVPLGFVQPQSQMQLGDVILELLDLASKKGFKIKVELQVAAQQEQFTSFWCTVSHPLSSYIEGEIHSHLVEMYEGCVPVQDTPGVRRFEYGGAFYTSDGVPVQTVNGRPVNVHPSMKVYAMRNAKQELIYFVMKGEEIYASYGQYTRMGASPH